jgi:HAD superfamily hydrolase (TIGR01509 family)
VTRPLEGIGAITFDFGNTLVRVDRAGLRRVVEATAHAAVERAGPFAEESFLEIWVEERERQFREEVPAFREVDIAQRIVRVLARLRGMAPPSDGQRWDGDHAAALVDDDEVADLVDAYSAAFVAAMPVAPEVTTLLATLATERPLAILSNWPLAATIDRYVEAAGWSDSLAAVVVSQRVGTIKPHPRIFAVARAALGDPEPAAILHVGDDWAADIAGASAVGWRTAWLHGRPADSPLPDSDRAGDLEPDLELDVLVDLESALGPPPP